MDTASYTVKFSYSYSKMFNIQPIRSANGFLCGLPQFLSARASEHFSGRASKLSINLEEILSSAHENFEEQLRSWSLP